MGTASARSTRNGVIQSRVEVLGQVLARNAGQFVPVVFDLNPGLADSFPWLSVIAQQYELFRFNKLRYIFKTSRTTSTTGMHVMGVDYDAADAQPGSILDLMNFAGSAESQIWANNMLTVSVDRKQRFVRTSAQPTGTSIHDYDLGLLYLAATTEGANDLAPSGFIFVEYEVEFFKPTVTSVGTSPSNATGDCTGAVRTTNLNIVGANQVIICDTVVCDDVKSIIGGPSYDTKTGYFKVPPGVSTFSVNSCSDGFVGWKLQNSTDGGTTWADGVAADSFRLNPTAGSNSTVNSFINNAKTFHNDTEQLIRLVGDYAGVAGQIMAGFTALLAYNSKYNLASRGVNGLAVKTKPLPPPVLTPGLPEHAALRAHVTKIIFAPATRPEFDDGSDDEAELIEHKAAVPEMSKAERIARLQAALSSLTL
jgi:hypothetical protein